MRHRLAGLFSIKGSLRRAYPFPPLIQLASMSDCEAESPTMGRHSHHLPEGKDRSHSGKCSLAWCGVRLIHLKKEKLTCQITLFRCVASKVLIFYNLGVLGDFKYTWNEVEIPSLGGGMPYPCCDGGSGVSDSLD